MEKIRINLEGEGECEVSKQALEKSKIPLIVLDPRNSKNEIRPKVSKGDILLFDFSPVNDKEERVLLFSATSPETGEKIYFKEGGDKLFLGVFYDKNEAKSFAFQIIFLIEALLGVKVSFSIKKDAIIAVIS